MNKWYLEALDRCLRDIRNNDRLFGGITLLIIDFRQTLPVIPRASRGQIVASTLRRSHLWSQIEQFTLSQNLRVVDSSPDFANWLLRVGNGEVEYVNEDSQFIQLPREIVLPPLSTLSTLEDHVFNQITNGTLFPRNATELSERSIEVALEYYQERAILASKNKAVRELNEHLLEKFKNSFPRLPQRTYYSTDELDMAEEDRAGGNAVLPTEFLNTIDVPGLTSHKLTLSIGCVVILLRININTSFGLANGTRLLVTRLQTNSIRVIIITGIGRGKEAVIPRVKLSPSDNPLP